mmetsp:Transcript_7565/g.11270  ORF Transcript_7565/g.11270 Transcript_7565/m.11270 type:complete len:80 (-) Transcript_7565:31-270(-)
MYIQNVFHAFLNHSDTQITTAADRVPKSSSRMDVFIGKLLRDRGPSTGTPLRGFTQTPQNTTARKYFKYTDQALTDGIQ